MVVKWLKMLKCIAKRFKTTYFQGFIVIFCVASSPQDDIIYVLKQTTKTNGDIMKNVKVELNLEDILADVELEDILEAAVGIGEHDSVLECLDEDDVAKFYWEEIYAGGPENDAILDIMKSEILISVLKKRGYKIYKEA